MKAQVHRFVFRWTVLASVLGSGLVGCSQGAGPSVSSSPKGGAGGVPSETGGTAKGTGGQVTGTGGTPLAAGGTATSSGGSVYGPGGNAGGTAGSPPGTDGGAGSGGRAGAGGRTVAMPTGGADGSSTGLGGSGGANLSTGGAGSGGRGGDGGPRDGTGVGADGPSDAASDAPTSKDAGPDAGPAQGDVAGTDGGIPVPAGYQLVWSDEFDVDGTPNPKNWNYEKGFVRNSELQWYQPDNATVKGGFLVIEARKEQVANPNYQAGSSDWKTNRQYADYTSTSMTTSGLQNWQYGRFEMRARIPTGAGMWPAWWPRGVNGERPSKGEIDIMEYYKGNVLANVACGTATRWTAKWDSSSKAISSLGSGWASSFHTWRMDWDDQTIDLYLDDALMNSVPLSSMLNADGTSPFKQKVYIIVNLAIGGVNGGDPSGTTFPQQYQIDWIRVFQKQ